MFLQSILLCCLLRHCIVFFTRLRDHIVSVTAGDNYEDRLETVAGHMGRGFGDVHVPRQPLFAVEIAHVRPREPSSRYQVRFLPPRDSCGLACRVSWSIE